MRRKMIFKQGVKTMLKRKDRERKKNGGVKERKKQIQNNYN